MMRLPKEFWDQQPFGKVSDAEIARAAGVDPSSVRAQRLKRGICIGRAGRGRKLDIDWDAQLLGEVIDRVIAESLGVGVSTVTQKRLERGIPACNTRPKRESKWDQEPLGWEPEANIAERMGVSVQRVRNVCSQRGIRTYNTQLDINWRRNLEDPDDGRVAERLGVRPEDVAHWREIWNR